MVVELISREIGLQADGRSPRYEYDKEGDILEIIFKSATATAAIELTESIVLRFDWDSAQPLSLGFISFSRLIQPTEYGEQHFRLLVERWPDEARDKIWHMLRTAPLNEFLQVSSYAPPFPEPYIPIASVKQPRVMAHG